MMNEEWRLERKLDERKLCIGCFASNKIPITQEVYQFSHDLVESGRLDKYIPTQENPLQEEVSKFGGDYFKMTCNYIIEAWNNK